MIICLRCVRRDLREGVCWGLYGRFRWGRGRGKTLGSRGKGSGKCMFVDVNRTGFFRGMFISLFIYSCFYLLYSSIYFIYSSTKNKNKIKIPYPI